MNPFGAPNRPKLFYSATNSQFSLPQKIDFSEFDLILFQCLVNFGQSMMLSCDNYSQDTLDIC